MTLRTAQACLLALGLVSYGGVASAGDPATAEALFRAGREASERGDAKVACERFRESYRLDAAPGTLLNIAACEEALHHLAGAWEKYQHLADSLPAGDDRVVLVNERLAALDTRLPRLTLEVGSGAPPPTVRSDGVLLSRGVFGVPLPMDPGEHRIVVAAPGRQTREYIAILDEGQRLSVHVEPGEALPPELPHPRTSPVPEPLPQCSEPSSGAGRGLRTAGYTAGGLGLAGFVTMGVLSALAFRQKGTADEHCPHHVCDDEGFQAVERGAQLVRLADIGLVVGIAGVAAGGVLIWQASRAEIRVQHTIGGLGLSYASTLP